MKDQEFLEEIKNFSLEKHDLKEKVDDLLGRGARKVSLIHFIIEQTKCNLSQALEIIESCQNYHRFK